VSTIRRTHVFIFLSALALCAVAIRAQLAAPSTNAAATMTGERTVADRVKEFGDVVHARLEPRFREVGVAYPPKKLVLVGLKQEGQLELWVSDGSHAFQFLKTYPILAASGTSGPKLKEGDRQVPEGLYKIESLNPNSRFHLALRVNYPNEFDKDKSRRDGRTKLGGDIMIHGGAASIGCLAMGDPAAEDLFVLAAETGIKNISVILAPLDFRVRDLPPNAPPSPGWTPELYSEIRKALAPLKQQH
jgi:L,D-transpeptidase catalytic domain